MAKPEAAETTVGVIALLVAIAGLLLVASANRVRTGADSAAISYTADFARIDGVHMGAPVRLAGVTVGKVTELKLDERFRAVVTLEFDRDVPVPDDSAAVVETDGIFGSKYIELQPGGSETNLKRGARLAFTQDAVIIEDLIAKIVQQAKATQKGQQP